MRDKVKQAAYNKAYREANKERIKELNKKYHSENRDKLLKEQKKYCEANKEKIKKTQKEWFEKNKDYVRKYYRNKYQSDTLFRLKKNIKNLIGNSLRNNKFKKLSKTEQILGCTYEEFMLYLESKFESWMSWDNRGLYDGTPNYGWDIDHIIPLDTATCEADLIRLNHYTNLQPLCSYINRDVKKNKVLSF